MIICIIVVGLLISAILYSLLISAKRYDQMIDEIIVKNQDTLHKEGE